MYNLLLVIIIIKQLNKINIINQHTDENEINYQTFCYHYKHIYLVNPPQKLCIKLHLFI